jgi:formamidopyrimidine-DNA glycosylase
MPELPEVESTARKMQQALRGEIFQRAQLQWKRSWSESSLAPRNLVNQNIQKVTRRGKFIVIQLERSVMLIHLRMSGRIDIDCEAGPHHRVSFTMQSGLQWHLRDPRKFGRVSLLRNTEAVFSALGPEPLDLQLRANHLHHLLLTRNRGMKTLLLDQSFLAGLGNIYVDEVLWQTGIHPLRNSRSITLAEARDLLTNIRKTLRRAIRLHGTDFGDYVVKDGRYQPGVYGRTGEPCLCCKSPITRIVVGQRGTHFCSQCQQLC